MSVDPLGLLSLLSGDERQFTQALVALGWYDYAPTLTDYNFTGAASASLTPKFKAAGEVRGTDAWVYRLSLPSGRWQDAVAIVESQLKREPQFAVVFCSLPGALLILVPSNPDTAFGKAKTGLTVDRIYLDTRLPSNFESETIKKLVDAPTQRFRARVQELVNTDRVTKKFYDRFKKELESFQLQIKGIPPESPDILWYSSVMLNRLMFIYFLQRKGFLNGERDYLSNRLRIVQERRGKDKFQSFYRSFLLRLFHEGLGSRNRAPELEQLLGNIPYLNGGLFEVHEIESRYVDVGGEPTIDIPDAAFESVFRFFNDYEWCLDTRPSRTEREINPDVLGYTFEKYVNQKEMGAYYTKEDITEYISRNAIIPYLFDAAKAEWPAPFDPTGFVWRLPKEYPDRYIFNALARGCDLPLPPDIEAGITAVPSRGNWNQPATEEFALPTEIWRETVARRQRHADVRAKLASGKITSINDFITYNLDIRRLVEDVVTQCDAPELLAAFWAALTNMRLLDPTVGSGAFLFAALNILEPLYEACLDRMAAFVDQSDRAGRTREHAVFRDELSKVALHPNRGYFVCKSIIVNNLYGVDIMKEATEICRLRLFLNLAAHTEPDPGKANFGLEPLPDIDFNIQAGNTLVGFATEGEVRHAITGSSSSQTGMDLDGKWAAFEHRLKRVSETFKVFQDLQSQLDLPSARLAAGKEKLREELAPIRDELDKYLGLQFGKIGNAAFEDWRKGAQPFHWFVEFYAVMKAGGFHVIVGNPPYVEYSKVTQCYQVKGYRTAPCGNLYALATERGLDLLKTTGHLGFIVPVSSIATEGYKSLQDVVFKYSGHFSSYDDRPARLFDGLEHIQLTIHLVRKEAMEACHFSTECLRWSAVERENVFSTIEYRRVASTYLEGCLPKLSSLQEDGILAKIWRDKLPLVAQNVKNSSYTVYYSRKVHNFLQALDFVPEVYNGMGELRAPSELKGVNFASEDEASLVFCLLNSTLFRWFINVFTDCRHVNKREVDGFKLDIMKALADNKAQWHLLASDLSASLKSTAEFRDMKFKHDNLRVQCIIPKKSKAIIDQIDRVLAKHYGFTDEETDFIINYDIKYRMGRGGDEVEEE